MKAEKLLRKNKSVTERAEGYITSIKRNIQKDILDALTTKAESVDDKIFELQDFTLQTDINSGQSAMTREACETRFKQLIDLEYQRELLSREIKFKTKAFNKYFSEKDKEVSSDFQD